MNRRVAGIISGLHFAPTDTAVRALCRQGVPKDKIFLTGNPVIDALRMILVRPIPEGAGQLLAQAGIAGNGCVQVRDCRLNN